MKILPLLATLALASAVHYPLNAQTGFPFTDENLNYSVNWPSGLSLGEGHMHARHAGATWHFELNLDAGVPGYQVKDTYRSTANAEFCSASLDRLTSHGTRKTEENETINGATVKRSTANGGGQSQFTAPDCLRDALTLLYFARRELGQGRVPPAQSFLFGGLNQIRMDYAGAQTITVGETSEISDKVICTVKTPSSEFKFEAYFARDPARTPLLFKAGLAMGMFSLELVR